MDQCSAVKGVVQAWRSFDFPEDSRAAWIFSCWQAERVIGRTTITIHFDNLSTLKSGLS